MKYLSFSLALAAASIGITSAQEFLGATPSVAQSGAIGTSVGVMPEISYDYSNLLFQTGSYFANGGAAGGAGTTLLVADDVTIPDGQGGGSMGTIHWSVVNPSLTTAFDPRMRIRMFDDDGANGGPGTALYGVTFNPFMMDANTWYHFVFNPTTSAFGWNTPTGRFWIGITFDNVGSTVPMTDADLNGFGQMIFDPVQVGSSTNSFFTSTAPGSNFANNPAGNIVTFNDGTPGNFFLALERTEVNATNQVTGTVTLGDYVAAAEGEMVKVSFSDGTVRYTELDAAGGFSVEGPGVDGTYGVTVQGRTWLSKSAGSVTIQFLSGGAISSNPTLLNGDVDGDNEVGLSDFGLLSDAFGAVAGDDAYAINADLDGDEEVGLSDFGILSANFGEVGD